MRLSNIGRANVINVVVLVCLISYQLFIVPEMWAVEDGWVFNLWLYLGFRIITTWALALAIHRSWWNEKSQYVATCDVYQYCGIAESPPFFASIPISWYRLILVRSYHFSWHTEMLQSGTWDLFNIYVIVENTKHLIHVLTCTLVITLPHLHEKKKKPNSLWESKINLITDIN